MIFRLMAFGLVVYSIIVYTAEPGRTVLELIITIFGVVVGIYYTFFRSLELW